MTEISRRNFIQTTGAGLLTMMPSLREDQALADELTNNGEDLCFAPVLYLPRAFARRKYLQSK
jgi:hypothetical protein